MTRESFDVAIVGGGVIGMACAEALSRDGKRRICIIEKDELGRAASWAGGGLLSPLPPDHIPEAIRPLLEESLALYPEWCERLHRESGIDPEYWVCGADYYKDDGTHIEYPQMAQVRNPRLMKALAETLRRRGVTMFTNTPVLGWQIDSGRVCAVRTERFDVECTQVILAAGAWSGPLGARGIVPVKGQMLLLASGGGALSKLLIGDDIYLIPRRDGQILIGSTIEDAGFDTTPTEEAEIALRARVARLWPEVRQRDIIGHWAGLRPRHTDDVPLLAQHPELPNLLLATGHFRIGLTLAPASAVHIRDLVLRDSSALI